MKINTAELKTALERVKPGLANKDLVEQATSFAFLGDRVVTYNDEISVSHPVNNLNIRGAIKAQTMYAFLSKLKAEEVDFTQEDSQIILKAKRSKAGLYLESKITLPIEEVGDIPEWNPLPDDFLDGLKLCVPCCATDMSRPIITCVNVAAKQMEASDGYQVIVYRLDSEMPVDPFLLPVSAARALLAYPVKHIAAGANWVHFKTNEGTVFSSRVLSDTFPNLAQILAVEGESISFPKSIAQSLDKAKVFSRPIEGYGPKSVSIHIEDGRIHVMANNGDGWFDGEARIQYKGTPMRFIVGVDFLYNLLGRVQDCVIGASRIQFLGDKWTHVIAISPDA